MAENLTGTLNIQRNLFLEKEELDQWQEFIRNNVPLFLFGANTSSYGIVKQQSLSDADFEIVTGSNTGTLRMVNDSYIIDNDKLVGYLPAFNNLNFPASNTYYWLKVKHRYYNAEPGNVISIDTSTNTVTGDGTDFEELIRGQVTGVPTRIKFYNEDEYGNEISVNNTGIYEVIEVTSPTSMVLAGDLVAESGNVKFIVIGAYTLGTQLSTEQKNGLFNYDYATLEWVSAVDLNTEPSGLITDKEFWIAAVYYNSSTGDVSIEDKRSQYWTLSFGATLDINDATTSKKGIVQLATETDIDDNTGGDEVITSDLANSNLILKNKYSNVFNVTESDFGVIGSTTTLTLTDSQGIIDVDINSPGGDGRTLNIDLPEPSVNNKNHTVYFNIDSEKYTGGFSVWVYKITTDSASTVLYTFSTISSHYGRIALKSDGLAWNTVIDDINIANLKNKVIEIGAWDMDADTTHSVTHGIGDFTNIRKVDAMIIKDDSSIISPLNSIEGAWNGNVSGGIAYVDSTSVQLRRIPSGDFDSVDFSSTSINRGYVTIHYEN